MKVLIILVLIFFSGCSSSSKLDKSKVFVLNVERLEMWFDAMPKVDSKSKFHLLVDYSLKNISNKVIKINSLSYELILSNDKMITFYDKSFSPINLSKGEMTQFANLNLSSEVNLQIPKIDRRADLYLNIHYESGKKKFSERVFIKSQEFEIVY